MQIVLLFSLFGGSMAGVVSVQPRVIDIIIPRPNDTTGIVDPSQLIPRMSPVEARSTTACGCGYSVVNPAAGRIVGGQVASPAHKYPYQAFIVICFMEKSGRKECFSCGGTLLNKRYVLTAMHCVKNGNTLSNDITVTLGAQNVRDDEPSQQKFKAERIITRDDYDISNSNNDIAILRLSGDVQMNSNVVPACLPTTKANSYANMDAVTSGWGTTSEGGLPSKLLKETTVRITTQSDPTCTKYGSGGVPPPSTKMCAYQAGTDSCQGDSGGPLVLKEDGRNTVVGVVSYGAGCAKPGYAGVYARVTTYLDWINANIQDGWCSGSVIFSTPQPEPVPTPKPGSSTCDLTCFIGTESGTFQINGIPVVCSAGRCSSMNGVDLCSWLSFPCSTN